MVMSRVERIMARRQVDAEIRTDPIQVAIIRRPKIDTLDGGWRWGVDITLSPITVLIMPAKRRMGEMTVNTDMGEVVNYPYILLGYYSDDIIRDDSFYWNGDRFQVKTLHIKDQVSKTAQIDYFGGINNA